MYIVIGFDHNVILQKYEVMFSEFMETAQSNEGLRKMDDSLPLLSLEVPIYLNR